MRVWIDIDNAPHVAFFRPIIADLRAAGAEVKLTARARAYVPELLSAACIDHDVIGRGQPRGFVGKALAVGGRSLDLAWWARGRAFDVAIGHGSRALPPAASALRIPNMTTYDYEYVNSRVFDSFCDRIVLPRIVHDTLTQKSRKHHYYEGFKEEVYLDANAADPGLRDSLGIPAESVMVVVRPPARAAHYHDERSEAISSAIVRRFTNAPAVAVVWLRRDPGDPVPAGPNIIAPGTPVDGVSLLAAADLVVSGGGTMIREAALLGTPAYSMFMGREGAVDKELARRGWLKRLNEPRDVESISIERKRAATRPRIRATVRGELISQIVATSRREAATAREVPWESPSSI